MKTAIAIFALLCLISVCITPATAKSAGQTDTPPTPATVDVPCVRITGRGLPIYGTLAGYDPEGDDLTYVIVSYPTHGSLRVTDQSGGGFCYLPRRAYTGEDSFTYVVRDAYGNYSSPTTVKIRVERGKADLDFADLIPTPWGS